jgi:DNA-binding transcriptional LysR family regulator
VAEERSFTRAAARLGTSQSTLSHTVRRLETRLGLRLLSRTTRNVVPTEAGERLIETLRPAFDDIDSKLAALTELREKPAGTVRLTSGQRVAETIIWPALKPLLREFPDIKVELSIDQALTNIVAERYDGGVRLGEQVEKDMIAVRIGPDLRMAVVAAQSYLDAHGAPKSPQELTLHNCINLRLPTFGGLYAWEFERDGRELNVRVGGQLTFNYVPMVLEAACGAGSRRLVPTFCRLSSVLSQPTPDDTGLRPGAGGAALSRLTALLRPRHRGRG